MHTIHATDTKELLKGSCVDVSMPVCTANGVRIIRVQLNSVSSFGKRFIHSFNKSCHLLQNVSANLLRSFTRAENAGEKKRKDELHLDLKIGITPHQTLKIVL